MGMASKKSFIGARDLKVNSNHRLIF